MGITFFDDEKPALPPVTATAPGKRVWTDEELSDAMRENQRRAAAKRKANNEAKRAAADSKNAGGESQKSDSAN